MTSEWMKKCVTLWQYCCNTLCHVIPLVGGCWMEVSGKISKADLNVLSILGAVTVAANMIIFISFYCLLNKTWYSSLQTATYKGRKMQCGKSWCLVLSHFPSMNHSNCLAIQKVKLQIWLWFCIVNGTRFSLSTN